MLCMTLRFDIQQCSVAAHMDLTMYGILHGPTLPQDQSVLNLVPEEWTLMVIVGLNVTFTMSEE